MKGNVDKKNGASVAKKTDIFRVLFTREVAEKEKQIEATEVSHCLGILYGSGSRYFGSGGSNPSYVEMGGVQTMSQLATTVEPL